jgi:hypothetical protein
MRRLTVKLRGRPGARDQAPRAHNVFRARDADIQADHGPLQRLLDVTSYRLHIAARPQTNFRAASSTLPVVGVIHS